MSTVFKKLTFATLFITITTVALLTPVISNAQGSSPSAGSGGTSSNDAPIKSITDIIKLLDKFQTYVARIFWIIAIISVFYSAFLYATSGGNEKNTGKARDQLFYAVIAMAIAIMAYGLPQLIKSILSSGS